MSVISFCSSVGANTGQIACDTSRGVPKVILVGSAEFSTSDTATSSAFKSALLSAIKKATGDANKLYPFPEIVGNTPSTEANKEATTGYGVKFILSEGRPAYTFDIICGINTEKQLRKFNKQTMPVYVFDDGGNVWGRVNASSKFVAPKAQLFVTGAPFGDGNNLSLVKVTVAFQSANEFYDDAAFVNTDFSTSDLEGLLDATLAEAAAHATNTYYVSVKVKNASLGNDVNMHDTYETELASAALWKAENVATGAQITVTGVTSNAAGYFNVVLDSTAYAALSNGAAIKISLAAPSVLDAAGVTGIEGLALSVVK